LLDELFTTQILLNSNIHIISWKSSKKGETKDEYVWIHGTLRKVRPLKKPMKPTLDTDQWTDKQKQAREAMVLPFTQIQTENTLLRFGDDEELSEEDPDADLFI
jgi:hypothetical protein